MPDNLSGWGQEQYPYSLEQLADIYSKKVPGTFDVNGQIGPKQAVPQNVLDVLGLYMQSKGTDKDAIARSKRMYDPASFTRYMPSHDPGTSPHLYDYQSKEARGPGGELLAGGVERLDRDGNPSNEYLAPGNNRGKSVYITPKGSDVLGTYLHEGVHLYSRAGEDYKNDFDNKSLLEQYLKNPMLKENWDKFYKGIYKISGPEELNKLPRWRQSILLDEMRAMWMEEQARNQTGARSYNRPEAVIQSFQPDLYNHLYEQQNRWKNQKQ